MEEKGIGTEDTQKDAIIDYNTVNVVSNTNLRLILPEVQSIPKNPNRRVLTSYSPNQSSRVEFRQPNESNQVIHQPVVRLK